MVRGRFAPSPTGPLHFGSLVAAVASYLDARSRQGEWLLRMEDLDTAREVPGAADAILLTLEKFGFEWDGAVVYQSQRLDLYAEKLAQLTHDGLVYPCGCTRKEIADSQLHGDNSALGIIYPGTCRNGLPLDRLARAWRMRVDKLRIDVEDAIQGSLSQQLDTEAGDFVLKRADGLFAYQLAVVSDDAEQGITHIVRGADLLDSTPRQRYLQQCLQLPQPVYAHVPVAANAAGEKLSKQTLARAVDNARPLTALWLTLDFLGQQPPPELQQSSINEFWGWATAHWQLQRVPRLRSIACPD